MRFKPGNFTFEFEADGSVKQGVVEIDGYKINITIQDTGRNFFITGRSSEFSAVGFAKTEEEIPGAIAVIEERFKRFRTEAEKLHVK
jgi:hypothetical protein